MQQLLYNFFVIVSVSFKKFEKESFIHNRSAKIRSVKQWIFYMVWHEMCIVGICLIVQFSALIISKKIHVNMFYANSNNKIYNLNFLFLFIYFFFLVCLSVKNVKKNRCSSSSSRCPYHLSRITYIMEFALILAL